jgi:putative flippase GtrA
MPEAPSEQPPRGRTYMQFNWRQLLRYYQAGVVNTLFGYGCYAALLWVGLDMFIAQLISHTVGTLFNYFTFSRYAFVGEAGSPLRFVASYAGNYLLSLAVLWVLSQAIASPYVAGLVAVVIVSAINFLIIKRFVFRPAAGSR